MKRYDEVRHLIETGDLISCEGDAIFSGLIQRWTKSSVSHSGLAVWAGESLWMLESMEPVGVQVRALSFIGNFKWLPIKATEGHRHWLQQTAISHIGRIPYSKRGIALQILKPIFGSVVEQWVDDGTTICSRYVAWHLKNSLGYTNAPTAPAPDELELWAEINAHDKTRSDGSIRILNPEPEPIKLT